MENEFMKRGYLLPEGCKDLSGVAKPPLRVELLSQYLSKALGAKSAMSLPPVNRQIVIPPHTTAKKLAALLGQKPFRIICDLAQLGTFASVYDVLEFHVISDVARMHGFLAIRAG